MGAKLVKPRPMGVDYLLFFFFGMLLLFPTITPAVQEKDIGLTLMDCLRTALAKNPLAIEAGLGVKSAEETVASAQGRHWPRLSLDGTYTRRQEPFPYIQAQAVNIPPHFSDIFSSLGLTLTLPLYQGGRFPMVWPWPRLGGISRNWRPAKPKMTLLPIQSMPIIKSYNFKPFKRPPVPRYRPLRNKPKTQNCSWMWAGSPGWIC